MTLRTAPLENTEGEKPFRDRRTGLIIFGCLSCVIGAFAGVSALLVPMSLMMLELVPKQPGVVPPDFRSIIILTGFYAIVAVLFIWIGVDSFRARRWIRPIIISIGWTWLIVGICGMASLYHSVPRAMEMFEMQSASGGAPVPRELKLVIAVSTVGMALFLYLVVPIAYLLFYSGKNVRATLEHYDPAMSWTERVPVQILGLSVGLVAAAASMLITAIYAIFPFFTRILTGVPAVVASIVIGLVFALSAVLVYRRRMSGWWLTMVLSMTISIRLVLRMNSAIQRRLYACCSAAVMGAACCATAIAREPFR